MNQINRKLDKNLEKILWNLDAWNQNSKCERKKTKRSNWKIAKTERNVSQKSEHHQSDMIEKRETTEKSIFFVDNKNKIFERD